MKKEEMEWSSYSCCNFIKLPNWVGIVPESDLEGRFLWWLTIMQKVSKKKKKKNEKKGYNLVILFGFEESQVTPVWSHKSLAIFQFKLPFDVKEL